MTLSEPVSLLLKFVNFAVLVWMLLRFGGPPFKNFLKNRHKVVQEKIDEAEQLLKEASDMKAAYTQKLASIDQEIEALRATAVAEAEREKAKILDEAKALAARIGEQAKLAYDQELKEAMARVRAEIAKNTLLSAEKTVRDVFKKEDHDRLVEEFIEKLRSLN